MLTKLKESFYSAVHVRATSTDKKQYYSRRIDDEVRNNDQISTVLYFISHCINKYKAEEQRFPYLLLLL